LEQVQNTAPFLAFPPPSNLAAGDLIHRGEGPRAFLDILPNTAVFANPPEEFDTNSATQRREDYFAYCIACHHATVATFVPTDVDTKIRGLLWRETRDPESLRRMFRFAQQSMLWSIDGISTRATAVAGVGPVSGHNGEQLSILAGALGAFTRAGDTEFAAQAAAAIDAELEREVTEFAYALKTPGLELEALKIATSLTHNVGDLDQGISFWSQSDAHKLAREPFHRLAHENKQPYRGMFQTAAAIYRRGMSAEGHRHYPLRAVKALRRSPDFLLPLGPFLDDWGRTIGSHSGLSDDERAEVLAALIAGCRKIPGQRGYFRAIHGMLDALGGRADRIVNLMPARSRSDLRDPELRKAIAVPRHSFESMMKKTLREK
jgi:hypothetical protein